MAEKLAVRWDTARVREAFPILKEVVYLNTGTYGVVPEPAVAKLLEYVADFDRGGVAAHINYGAATEESRRRIAALLCAEPDEIAFTRNATDGINLALAGLPWQPGDEAITTAEEHPAIAHPLLYLQSQGRLRIRTVEVSPRADEMIPRLEQVVTPTTRLVIMSHVTCETGTRLPAKEITAWAAARAIATVFDGAQALGAIPVNVREIGCDYYTSNGHKWLGGPKGTGVFYARMDKVDRLFIAHVGAGSLERAEMETGEVQPSRGARRFEYGTRAWALTAGLGASLDWLEGLGFDAIYARIAGLANYAKQRVLERPYLTLVTPLAPEQSSGLTSFALAGKEAGAVSTRLREKYRILVRVVTHYNAIRIATAHFNSEEDVDRLMQALDEIVAE